MHVFYCYKFAKSFSRLPGCWRPSANGPVLTCPKCEHEFVPQNRIANNGDMEGILKCPRQDCDFHESAKLESYRGR